MGERTHRIGDARYRQRLRTGLAHCLQESARPATAATRPAWLVVKTEERVMSCFPVYPSGLYQLSAIAVIPRVVCSGAWEGR